MPIASERLRVALLTGSLGIGGAEKQLVYMAKALRDSSVDVRVYSLTRGEHYEAVLRQAGLQVTWLGDGSPARRLTRLLREVRSFRPHILQTAQFFTGLYAALAGRLTGALAISALRSDAEREAQNNGAWFRALLTLPHAVIANSTLGAANAVRLGAQPGRMHVLPNVIDLEEFDRRAAAAPEPPLALEGVSVALVANFAPVKRHDRFLEALASARQTAPQLRGLLVGDGATRAALEAQAAALGLLPGGVVFAGRRTDVPGLLARCQALVLASDREGFPNVILEGMAAGLPVVSTPAGDAPKVVQDGETGFLVPFEAQAMADRFVELAGSEELRMRLGAAGRRLVEQRYSSAGLAGQLFAIYRQVAEQNGRAQLAQRLLTAGG